MSDETLELKVPSPGESVSEVQIAKWLKKEGDAVAKDDDLAELESEKATFPLVSPAAGRLTKILRPAGQMAKVNEAIAVLALGAGGSAPAPAAAPASGGQASPAPAQPAPAAHAEAKPQTPPPAPPAAKPPVRPSSPGGAPPFVMPAADRVLAERRLSPGDVTGTGPGGRILKSDVLAAQPAGGQMTVSRPTGESVPALRNGGDNPRETVTRMSMLRKTIARRLVQAQHEAALLTTFNEADMSAVMDVRARYKDEFVKKHGVKLGFMSFFVKASVEALKRFPAVNAEIRGEDIVHKHYYDIGIAIGGGKGLVVPVIRGVDQLGFAAIEKTIVDLGERAVANKIKPTELEGGTFTISNGGVYGSLLSTPIVNLPQSGVLGMHSIQERPVAVKGQVVIRPMMYLALSYDHRIVDGREAVTFLKTIKELIEDPSRLMLDL